MLNPDQGLSVTSSKSHLSPSGSPNRRSVRSLRSSASTPIAPRSLSGGTAWASRQAVETFRERAASGDDVFQALMRLGDLVPLDRSGADPVTGLDLVGIRDLLARLASCGGEQADYLGTEPAPPGRI